MPLYFFMLCVLWAGGALYINRFNDEFKLEKSGLIGNTAVITGGKAEVYEPSTYHYNYFTFI